MVAVSSGAATSAIRLARAGADGQVSIPTNAEIIDARGRMLMPGLWDMHVHIQPNDGLMHIAAGVTSVRDMGNDSEALLKLKSDIEANREIGPRILMAGFMDGRGPYAGPTKVFVDTEEEARAAIDETNFPAVLTGRCEAFLVGTAETAAGFCFGWQIADAYLQRRAIGRSHFCLLWTAQRPCAIRSAKAVCDSLLPLSGFLAIALTIGSIPRTR